MASISRSNQFDLLRAPLFWLAIAYVLTGVVYVQVTPALEKPDEDGHYGYMLYLRENMALPPLTFVEGFASEYKQPPLYYVVAAILTRWLPIESDPQALLVTNPYVDYSVPGFRNDNRNVFLHPPYLTPTIRGGRFVSLLFGLGTVIACYFLAATLFPTNPLVAISTAVVVGFHPKFLFISTAVNNDAAIACLSAWIVAALIYRVQKGPFPHFAVLLGVLIGLGSITKVSGLVFIPLTGLALLFIHRGFSRAFFRDATIVIALVLLVGGWWYMRNWWAYGDPLSIDTHISDAAATRPFRERIAHDLSSIERTFWANLSRVFVSPIWLDKILIWWGRISLLLLLAGLWLNRRSLPIKKPALLILLSWPITLFVLLVVYWTRQSWWAYGRLLLPAIGPIAFLFVLGWLLISPNRWQRWIVGLGVGPIAIVGILTPFVSIRPLYQPWRELSTETLEYTAGLRFIDPTTGTPVAELVGYNLPHPFAKPGDFLPIELCWKALSQTEIPYAVFVHLLDTSQLDAHGAPGIWGSRRTYPGLGNLSTDRWTPGQAFCDTVLVQVSPEAPTPLGSTIEVGLIEPHTEIRLQAQTLDGTPIDLPIVRGVPIVAPEAVPAVGPPARYILDGAIALSNVEFSGSAQDTLTVTLTWQAMHPVSYDATTFVHLRERDAGLLAQVDSQPLNGRFPTSYWLPGQVVTDVFGLRLTPEVYDGFRRALESGALELNVGMYTWPTMDRLPATDESGMTLPSNVIVVDVPKSSSAINPNRP